MNILLVEDETVFQNLLKIQLNKLGFKDIIIAESGEQALELAKTYLPEVAFLDINLLSEMDGIATAKILKRSYPEIDIIFVSANQDKETLKEMDSVENLGFIHKPYNTELIEQYLRVATIKLRKSRRNKSSD